MNKSVGNILPLLSPVHNTMNGDFYPSDAITLSIVLDPLQMVTITAYTSIASVSCVESE